MTMTMTMTMTTRPCPVRRPGPGPQGSSNWAVFEFALQDGTDRGASSPTTSTRASAEWMIGTRLPTGAPAPATMSRLSHKHGSRV
jgi:hypothetical protein